MEKAKINRERLRLLVGALTLALALGLFSLPALAEPGDYGTALSNGGFTVTGAHPRVVGNPPRYIIYDWDSYKTVDGFDWHTTSRNANGDIEYQTVHLYNMQPKVGNYYAELNAYEASALFQPVQTTPGSTMRWKLYHSGQHGTDTMAVVIGPGFDTFAPPTTVANRKANALLTDRWTLADFQAVTALVTNGPYEKDLRYEVNHNGHDWLVWITESPDMTWTKHEGLFTVPAGQETTIFAFVSLSGVGTNGNLLDDITFQTIASIRVTNVLTDITSDRFNDVPGDIILPTIANYTETLSVAPGYLMPDTIAVRTGNRVLDATDFAYDPDTGRVEIPRLLYDGNIVITAAGIRGTRILVSKNLVNIRTSNETIVPIKEKLYTVTLTSRVKRPIRLLRVLISGITYQVNTKTGIVTGPAGRVSGISFSPRSGELTIFPAMLTGDVVIMGISGYLNSPQTGDDSHLPLWGATALTALLLLALLGRRVCKRRRC